MKFIVGLASVLVLSFTVEAGVARGFRIIYGNQQVSYPNSKAIAVRLQAANDDWSDPIGARLEFVRASTKGRFCANIKTQSVSGNAFASMYIILTINSCAQLVLCCNIVRFSFITILLFI
jgi:hypothetical protein